MRASEQESTGSAGVSAVCAKFEMIGWAPARNEAHDLGTDLLVAARDFRRFDRGLIAGVQVNLTEPRADVGQFDVLIGPPGRPS